MQEYLREVRGRLERLTRTGKSLRRLASEVDLGFEELWTLLHEERASDQTIGRLLAFFQAKNSKAWKRKLELVQNYTRTPRKLYDMEVALYFELTLEYKRNAFHPMLWQDRSYEERKIKCIERDLYCKFLLMQRVIDLLPMRGVFLNDRDHYFQWKIELNRALNPSASPKEWLSTLPGSEKPRTRPLRRLSLPWAESSSGTTASAGS